MNHKKITHHVIRKLTSLERKKHHHYVHKIHHEHHISYKTLFYLKEYGPHSHVASVIIKESIKILILASFISSIGGFGLHSIQEKVLMIIPLLIMLPALNDMIGDFGVIVSSKFTTLLYTGKITGKWWKSTHVHELFATIFTVAIISSLYISVLALVISFFQGYPVGVMLAMKIIEIAVIATITLVVLIFFISMAGGFYIYHKKEDPNNFLIPIGTSIADMGSMLILTGLVVLMF